MAQQDKHILVIPRHFGPWLRQLLLISVIGMMTACGGGGDDAPPVVTPPPTGNGNTVISGKATYARVPHSAANNSLDYNSTFGLPIRGATIELLSAAGAVLESATTDDAGDFSFTTAQNTQVNLRVKAMSVSTGVPAWDVEIIDNTNSGSLYVLDSGAFTATGTAMTQNVTAGSGWGGSSYTAERAAGPFALLDSVYSGIQRVINVDPSVVMPSLKMNWSVDNRPTQGNVAVGEIGTSYYSRSNGQSEIYVLGAENSDTDEYDHHVVVHEWTHYLEDRLSRSDSLGGSHSGGDRLDPRVAWGEGLATAVGAIVLDDPNVIDTLGNEQAAGFNTNIEQNTVLNPGWYSEGSVQSLVYDFYDSASDGTDAVTLGFAPIYATLTGQFKDTDSLTTIYAFADALKADNANAAGGITALVENQSVVSSATDEYGTNETNNAGNTQDVLPVYRQLTFNTTIPSVCSNSVYGHYNKLTNRRFFRFSAPQGGSFSFTATGPAGSDPDVILHQGGFLQVSEIVGTSETLSRNLTAGDYVVELYEYANTTDQPRGRTCFSVSATLN